MKKVRLFVVLMVISKRTNALWSTIRSTARQGKDIALRFGYSTHRPMAAASRRCSSNIKQVTMSKKPIKRAPSSFVAGPNANR
jgi:hypothetical protein